MPEQKSYVCRTTFLLAFVLLCLPLTARGGTQTLAAGKAQTNLPTETVWSGAQNPPYICCWNAQGQYVTFSFTVASAGPTTLALRYSAGDGAITRELRLDGASWISKQTFPRTANWDTWAVLTLSDTLSAGAHTLTVLFDVPSGSAGFLNLDNLTVSQSSTITSQTLAAGKAQTNLATETTWPGAQDPPYICCWSTQGQYVTFSFSVAGAPTSLALRYSAGDGPITRKVEVDGLTLVANQTFPGTPNWSTWTTLNLTRTLSAGAHTLTLLFDTASGSTGYLNLDNLTVSYGSNTTPPPPGITVALGYADNATGLSPWSGSPNTVFIGEGPQCCSTHGPDNGSPGYDSGAIEITNSGQVSMAVNAIAVDFGGGSSPSSFALWGGSTTTRLPQTLAVGEHLVLTMTSSFNFDTSDLFGEACHINSGVVPLVHVTLNGVTTDYLDDHQILNSDGADLASCPGDVSEQVAFTTVVPGSQPAAAPKNDVAPSITGIATQSHIMSGFAGGWNASPPPAVTLQWQRCNSSGASCLSVGGATGPTYIPTAADVGSRLRLAVTAANTIGKSTLYSSVSRVVAASSTTEQMGDTSTGFTSVYVQSATELDSAFTAASAGTTTDFEFFARGAGGTQLFTPRIYAATNGVKGALLGTGPTITVPKGANGQWYVAALSGVKLNAGGRYVLALLPSGVPSTYVGAETNGEKAFFVDFTP